MGHEDCRRWDYYSLNKRQKVWKVCWSDGDESALGYL